jgi:hypothetical protein
MCTFLATGNDYTSSNAQTWYLCRSCKPPQEDAAGEEDDALAICAVCALRCHKGHDLIPEAFGPDVFVCGCGQQGCTATRLAFVRASTAASVQSTSCGSSSSGCDSKHTSPMSSSSDFKTPSKRGDNSSNRSNKNDFLLSPGSKQSAVRVLTRGDMFEVQNCSNSSSGSTTTTTTAAAQSMFVFMNWPGAPSADSTSSTSNNNIDRAPLDRLSKAVIARIYRDGVLYWCAPSEGAGAASLLRIADMGELMHYAKDDDDAAVATAAAAAAVMSADQIQQRKRRRRQFRVSSSSSHGDVSLLLTASSERIARIFIHVIREATLLGLSQRNSKAAQTRHVLRQQQQQHFAKLL